ncbi:MAG: (deoxy)nucleoside triphosphate pyrophosphohydrolase [Anaeroplasma sp.]
MKHYKVVCALIENEHGKVFCCKRGPGRALEGLWEFPGGKVEEGETHQESLVREIKEELKSDIEVLNYLGESYYEYLNMESYKDFAITLYGYRCRLVSGELELTEHTESKWVLPNLINKDEFAPADRPLIDFIRRLCLL